MPPAPTPPPPAFHVSTRHSARRQTADREREAKKQEEEDLVEEPLLHQTTEGGSDEQGPDVADDAAPTASKRARTVGDENDEADGAGPPIRKASMNPTRFDRILGKYLVGDANLMCMEILQQMNNNAESSTAMSGATPPVAINWIDVSTNLQSKHQLHLKPRECQDLWKYLAYDQAPAVGMDLLAPGLPAVGDEIAADSDVEDFNATAEFLANKRASRKKAKEASATDDQQPTTPSGQAQEASNLSATLPLRAPSTLSAPVATPSFGFTSTAPSLYPSFDPPGFLKSDAADDASNYAPLHTVAEQFLKRRRGENSLPPPTPKQPIVRAPLPSTSAAGPSKPPLQTPVQHMPHRTNPNSVASGMPRQPPPQPTPSISAFEVFKRMYSDSTGLDDLRLQALYEQSPAEVRSRCLMLAAQDLERYQKECLRQRLYEKSVRGTSTPPATPPRPAASAQPTVQPDVL